MFAAGIAAAVMAGMGRPAALAHRAFAGDLAAMARLGVGDPGRAVESALLILAGREPALARLGALLDQGGEFSGDQIRDVIGWGPRARLRVSCP